MKKFELGIGYMGNGATCWNSAVEEHGDYQTVAHISEAGNIRWYIPIEKIPAKELLQIERLADCHRARTEDTMNTMIETQESFNRYLWKVADQLTFDQVNVLLNSLKKASTLFDKKLILIKTALQYL